MIDQLKRTKSLQESYCRVNLYLSQENIIKCKYRRSRALRNVTKTIYPFSPLQDLIQVYQGRKRYNSQVTKYWIEVYWTGLD